MTSRVNVKKAAWPKIRNVSSRAAAYFTGHEYDFTDDKDFNRARKDMIRHFQKRVDDGLISARMLWDDRSYKTKNIWQLFKDSLSGKQVLTKSFDKMMKEAFYEVDIDNSGTVDRAEFYAGMLVLYHKLNLIPWGGRKPPPKRQFVMELFDHYLQVQKQEELDLVEGRNIIASPTEESLSYETFRKLCRDHFETVVSSVLSRVILVTFLFPIIGLYLTEKLIESPAKKVFEPMETFLPSFFMGFLVFLLPYVEEIIVRRLWADRNGFAHFTVTPQGHKIRRKDKQLKNTKED